MKATLLVNLKVENGDVIPAGEKFDDEKGPFPAFIADNLENANIVKVEGVPAEKAPAAPAAKTAPAAKPSKLARKQ